MCIRDREWKGREILYPNDMHFFMQGRDTLTAASICMYKIITYIDSIGCMSCKLGLSQGQDFAAVSYTHLEEELLTQLKPDIERMAEANEETYEEACLHLKRQYDGYHFSKACADIYNPFSLSLIHILEMKQAMKDITYEQCENLARAMAERLKKDRK